VNGILKIGYFENKSLAVTAKRTNACRTSQIIMTLEINLVRTVPSAKFI